MGGASREKGKRGERELAKALAWHGYAARRGRQFSGADGSADVVGLPGIHIECKRVERLNVHEAMEQSRRDARLGELPVVMFRRNGGMWLVCQPLDEWICLYRAWERERSGGDGRA